MSNVNELLDMDLDDLADLPEFVVPPAGTYRALLEKVESKKIGEHPALEFKYKMLETIELEDPNATPVPENCETNEAYMTDNEFGVGRLKGVLKPLAAHYGTSKVSETCDAAAGTEVLLVTKVRQNKEKTQSYFSVHRLEVI